MGIPNRDMAAHHFPLPQAKVGDLGTNVPEPLEPAGGCTEASCAAEIACLHAVNLKSLRNANSHRHSEITSQSRLSANKRKELGGTKQTPSLSRLPRMVSSSHTTHHHTRPSLHDTGWRGALTTSQHRVGNGWGAEGKKSALLLFVRDGPLSALGWRRPRAGPGGCERAFGARQPALKPKTAYTLITPANRPFPEASKQGPGAPVKEVESLVSNISRIRCCHLTS